ncbi:hypothetical protein EU99_1802 [Prochlorococcus marinus str. MIT 9321]|uniref:Class II aldolase/adducin N-terminal domain-containing protein n=1 Tax=Prochlorococcus marinus str. MIT 9401 TaxID=167551 RepID=A0A0A2BBH2_PROMR|nr:class II aldolase/adducin family protein [Prochlorococcus marinus]KGG02840.1 hypothetical protein EU99_1802 [Prochlorococcus marinus str. MIT 9321]KGG05463.1 hypothetical protein EV00_1097 [Prochlorococcus marinus str. MIT 9322]KGG10497.1 hypothetical protein EV01_0125 [Prochlorococcus marinus str. MIT 9401]
MNNIDAEKFYLASETIGKDINLIQGAGGNTSYKEGESLIVKASGCKLKKARQEKIFVNLNRNKIIKQLSKNDNDLEQSFEYEKIKLRPSIETSMHAVIPHKYVFHVHCLNTLGLIVQEGFEVYLKDIFEDLNYAIIKYVKPGISLAKEISKVFSNSIPDVLFLSNHGLVVGGEDLDKIIEKIYFISNKLKNNKKEYKKLNHHSLENLSINSLFRPTSFLEAHQLAASKRSINIASSGSLYPDHVVFLGPSTLSINNISEFNDLNYFFNNKKKLPVIIYKDLGVLVPKDISYEAEEMVLALSRVVSNIPENSKINYLTKFQENELINWPAETYRFKLNSLN